MLEGLKRLFSSTPAATGTWADMATWAQSRTWPYREVAGEGFIIEGRAGTQPWRLEWGPSQRSYIEGQELRLRTELGVTSELQAVVMDRELQERGERDVFEQYVEGVQTRIDSDTPPELRWLVMFPKLPATELGPLKERYVALGSVKPWLTRWLQDRLPQAMAAQRLQPGQHLALVVARGRLTLRTSMPEADRERITGWVGVFEAAVAEALRASEAGFDSGTPTAPPSSSFPSSDLPRA